jgi:alkylation response protein AidB-like acyl-CoA dehydrogenase
VDPSVGLTVAAHISLCTNHIFIMGTPEQQQRWVPPLASGEKIGCWALTEPAAGSDAAGIKTTGKRDGDDWILNGTKCFCTNGSVGEIAVIFARTSSGKGAHGISAFVVEKGAEGFSVGKKENKMGVRASDTVELILEDCRVPDWNRLGPEGEGFVQAMQVLEGGRVSIGSMALGTGQGAYEACIKFAKEREAFGKPIAALQAIQWKLADMATELAAARMLIYRVAALKDQGVKNLVKEASMAKLFASEAAQRTCEQAVQLHGGYGFIKDYPVEKFYRDVKLTTVGEGTSEIQRLVISRLLLK